MSFINILKMLADENRLRIINIIKDHSLCVCQIQTILGIQQSNTSRHLEKLKVAEVITSYKDAQKVFYTINKDFLIENTFLTELIYHNMVKGNVYIQDIDRLNRYLKSGLSCDDLRLANYDFEALNI